MCEMENEKWIQQAILARDTAYVPYSKFKVGACIVTTDDRMYTGCNIENASYGLSNCAERTAIFKAVSTGERTFKHLVITGDTDGPIAPCGACRQVIAEFCSPEMPVTLCNLKGDIKITTVGELLPYAFTNKDL
ncbi:cytidine deaminase [Carnobacterium maltaromaticum]